MPWRILSKPKRAAAATPPESDTDPFVDIDLTQAEDDDATQDTESDDAQLQAPRKLPPLQQRLGFRDDKEGWFDFRVISFQTLSNWI